MLFHLYKKDFPARNDISRALATKVSRAQSWFSHVSGISQLVVHDVMLYISI